MASPSPTPTHPSVLSVIWNTSCPTWATCPFTGAASAPPSAPTPAPAWWGSPLSQGTGKALKNNLFKNSVHFSQNKGGPFPCAGGAPSPLYGFPCPPFQSPAARPLSRPAGPFLPAAKKFGNFPCAGNSRSKRAAPFFPAGRQGGCLAFPNAGLKSSRA